MKAFAALLGTAALALASVVAVQPATVPGGSGAVQIAAPAEVEAGTEVTVEVRAPLAADGTTAEVVVIAPYRTTVVAGTLRSGAAALPLPGDVTTAAGTVSLVAAVGQARAETNLLVIPGAAAEPVLPLVGARSIVADGADTAMVVAIPEDGYGNPLSDGTTVEFAIRRPDGGIGRQTAASRHTLAWVWVTAQTTAGRSSVAASTGSSRGPAATLLEVPDRPHPFSLELLPRAPLDADGASWVAVRTGVLADAYGNVLLDGTAATFTVGRAGATKSIIETDVIDGRATALVPAPDAAGTLVVRAAVAGTHSAPLTVAFGSALGAGRIAAGASWDDGTLTAEAGPLLGPLGELIDDGTPVELVVDGATAATVPTTGGRVRFTVPAPERPDLVAIVVAGTSIEVAS